MLYENRVRKEEKLYSKNTNEKEPDQTFYQQGKDIAVYKYSSQICFSTILMDDRWTYLLLSFGIACDFNTMLNI